MKSRYSGSCKGCGRGYSAGDEIYWTREEGAWHPECREQQTALPDDEAERLADKLGFE